MPLETWLRDAFGETSPFAMVSGGVGCCRGLEESEEKSRDLRFPGMTLVRARRRVAIELNGIDNEHNVSNDEE